MYRQFKIAAGLHRGWNMGSSCCTVELLYSGAGDIGTERPGLHYMLIRKTCRSGFT